MRAHWWLPLAALCLAWGCGVGLDEGRCGDGRKQRPEACDGADFGGATCRTQGFGGGTLACTEACTLSLDGCTSVDFATLAAAPFTMGSPDTEPCRDAEKENQHRVTLTRAFEMAITEVTQRQFLELMGYNPAAFSSTDPGCGEECYCGASSCGDHPVEHVGWDEAAAYCNALSAKHGLPRCYSCTGDRTGVACSSAPDFGGAKIYDCRGYRLPTEAEWERAYRSGADTAYYSGANDPLLCQECVRLEPALDGIAWYCANSGDRPHRVAQKAPNAAGLHDLAGNVYEWCHDWSPYPTPSLGGQAVTDPWGSATGPLKVIRGGSWYAEPRLARGSNRGPFALPTHRTSGLGLRCVRTM